jgi:hypothetical protein
MFNGWTGPLTQINSLFPDQLVEVSDMSVEEAVAAANLSGISDHAYSVQDLGDPFNPTHSSDTFFPLTVVSEGILMRDFIDLIHLLITLVLFGTP